ncbi:MAG: hypothetical protein GY936_00260 [Ignavibacteriae bacterium]|nr:hypothetical protein [Ignavibacteriota bacterium]
MKTLKIHIILPALLLLFTFTFCTETNSTEIPFDLDSGVTIAQTSDNISIAIATTNADGYDDISNINFVEDSVFVTLAVTLYQDGEASITFQNLNDSKVYTLNSNRTIANEFLNFKPTNVHVKVSKGYSATVGLAAVCK